MKTVIIYESVYGTTLLVAEELARVAHEHGDVDLVRAEEADAATVEGADLVLIGGPTHLHGMSTRATRQLGTAEPGGHTEEGLGPDVPGPGLRDWFRLSGHVDGTAAAAFDTRLDGPEFMTGRASVGIARRLRHHGFTEVAAPRSFLVTRENRLMSGEAERARQWAVSVYESLLADAGADV
jgi:hypothetical protein